jgi:hypothetical protein
MYLNYLKLLKEGFTLKNYVDSFKEKIKTQMDGLMPLKI